MTESAGKTVRLETNMGTIKIALDPAMPVTAGNFETLVQKGYYNGVIFHRVIAGFMLQGGTRPVPAAAARAMRSKMSSLPATKTIAVPSPWQTPAPTPAAASSSSIS